MTTKMQDLNRAYPPITETDIREIELTDSTLNNRLSKIESTQNEIKDILEKRWKLKQTGDENESRGNWSNHFEFILTCLGYAVGLGNVWRFPYLCYKNGGGAFFIPYVIFLVLVGMPIFLMELTLGQFTSRGALNCWRFAPIFKGIGFAMVIVSTMVFLYYNVIIAWALYYLFASFTDKLPWRDCSGNFTNEFCSERLTSVDLAGCTNKDQLQAYDNGTCYNTTSMTLYGIYNKTLAETFKIKAWSPAEQYLEAVALQTRFSSGFQDYGNLRWDMSLCLLLAWIIVFLSMIRGIKSSGKVVYFTALFPYLVLVILFINGLLQPGFKKGIDFYITPKLERLRDATVWKDAAVQIFFSLSASWGGIITLSSYNRFKTDVVRDMFIVAVGNCATSVFAGFVIFSYLGALSYRTGIPVEDVATSGVGLAFTIYPTAVVSLPAAPFWSILFFLMLITLGLDTQFALVETLVTSIIDQFPKTRKYKTLIIFLTCLAGFLIGLNMCTPGGPYMLQLMDDYAGGWNVLVISVFECIAVAWVYGAVRFCKDIEVMIGKYTCKCIPWYIMKWWWIVCWYVLSPGLVLFIMIFSWISYTPSKYGFYEFPMWANALGWLMTLVVVVSIIVTMIVMCFISKGKTFEDRIRNLGRPQRDWGPALLKHRRLITYAPNFVIDPYNEENEYTSKGEENPAYENL